MVELRGKQGTIILFAIITLGTFIFSTAAVKSEGLGWGDAIYWTACSLTWSNCYGSVDIPDTALTRSVSIFDGVATIVIVLVLLYAVGENILGLDLGGLQMESKISHMKNHFIVCGYGRVGEHVCDVFKKKGVKFVVVENNEVKLERAKENKLLVLEGNAIEPKILEKAGIKNSKGVITTLDSDADNLFIVLTAKELKPGIKVAARARNESSISKLHSAGAEVVVLPEIIGGMELAKEVLHLEESHKDKIISKVEDMLNRKQ